MNELWYKINTLLAHLRDFKAVERVRRDYNNVGNPAPGELLEQDVQKLQRWLDENEGKL